MLRGVENQFSRISTPHLQSNTPSLVLRGVEAAQREQWQASNVHSPHIFLQQQQQQPPAATQQRQTLQDWLTENINNPSIFLRGPNHQNLEICNQCNFLNQRQNLREIEGGSICRDCVSKSRVPNNHENWTAAVRSFKAGVMDKIGSLDNLKSCIQLDYVSTKKFINSRTKTKYAMIVLHHIHSHLATIIAIIEMKKTGESYGLQTKNLLLSLKITLESLKIKIIQNVADFDSIIYRSNLKFYNLVAETFHTFRIVASKIKMGRRIKFRNSRFYFGISAAAAAHQLGIPVEIRTTSNINGINDLKLFFSQETLTAMQRASVLNVESVEAKAQQNIFKLILEIIVSITEGQAVTAKDILVLNELKVEFNGLKIKSNTRKQQKAMSTLFNKILQLNAMCDEPFFIKSINTLPVEVAISRTKASTIFNIYKNIGIMHLRNGCANYPLLPNQD